MTDQSTEAVLFSGQDAFAELVKDAPNLSLSVFAWLLVFKGIAWSISLGNFRGGPTFPALFLGTAAGLLAGHLPGLSETPAVAVLMGAACVSMLRLPLSSIVIALLLTSSAGIAVGPLIIVAVATAYITTEVLSARLGEASKRAPAEEPAPIPAATPTKA